jgi:hypothetical protein
MLGGMGASQRTPASMASIPAFPIVEAAIAARSDFSPVQWFGEFPERAG